MNNAQDYDIYVVVHQDDMEGLDFDLITDWGVKPYSLDAQALKQYGRMSSRKVIAECAAELLDSANEKYKKINLIFK